MLIKADCREIPLSHGTVDLVFTSPPYENARTYGIGFNLRGQDWVSWAVPRFRECLRVCKGLVAWVVQGKTENFGWSATPALLMAALNRLGVELRNPPIFHRVGIPGSGGPDWLRADYEWIICATNGGKLPWSDNTAMGHPPRWAPGGAMSHRLSDGTRRDQWGGTHPAEPRQHNGAKPERKPRPSHDKRSPANKRSHTKTRTDGSMEVQHYSPSVIANPGNVIHCDVGGDRMGSPLAHESEAPFPEKLAEFFIRSFCPPEGFVLDPMCGSGTTLAVAKQLGRHGWGMDIRQSQIDLTQRRLKHQQLQIFKEAT